MLDEDGEPQLLEVNSNPSMAIDYEHEDDAEDAKPGATVKEPSPVDIAVKQRVLSDMLRVVLDPADASATEHLSPIVGGGASSVAARDAPPPPRALGLLGQ